MEFFLEIDIFGREILEHVPGEVLPGSVIVPSDKNRLRLPCGYKIELPDFRETLKHQADEWRQCAAYVIFNVSKIHFTYGLPTVSVSTKTRGATDFGDNTYYCNILTGLWDNWVSESTLILRIHELDRKELGQQVLEIQTELKWVRSIFDHIRSRASWIDEFIELADQAIRPSGPPKWRPRRKTRGLRRSKRVKALLKKRPVRELMYQTVNG